MQSLAPSMSGAGDGQKRTLLVVYIHGFMGSNTSFRSFPAHVHHFLKQLLAETHVIHTKIYPRYKTYKSIHVARDNFSKWLAPHESASTDIVLVGHSMGGLLAADVVLLVCALLLAHCHGLLAAYLIGSPRNSVGSTRSATH
jgi:pimeloyl-ACP methyl ester carboxylesterase